MAFPIFQCFQILLVCVTVRLTNEVKVFLRNENNTMNTDCLMNSHLNNHLIKLSHDIHVPVLVGASSLKSPNQAKFKGLNTAMLNPVCNHEPKPRKCFKLLTICIQRTGV